MDEYLNAAPAEHQPALAELRELIRGKLPGAHEQLDTGFPVYADGDRWLAGFAARGRGVMFYLMNSAILDRWNDRLAGLRSGRSCLEWKPSSQLALEDLRSMAGAMLDELAASR